MGIFSLIGRLHDLDRLNNSHIQLFLEVDPRCVEPLLIEIFDLKPPPGAGIHRVRCMHAVTCEVHGNVL